MATINNTKEQSSVAKSTQTDTKSQNTLITELNVLASKREEWQSLYDRTNSSLYDLLAGCLGFYHKIKGKPVEKAVVKILKDELEKRKMTIQKNTTVFLLIVRYVFNTERRRSHTYARALAIAVNDGVTPKGFAKWVRDEGGIEDVVAKGSTNATKKKKVVLLNNLESVKDMLITQIEKPLAIVPKSKLLKTTESNEYTLLIGKTQADGKTRVLSVVPNASDKMIEDAIKNIANELMKQYEETHKPKLVDEQQEIMSEMFAEVFGKAATLKKAA